MAKLRWLFLNVALFVLVVANSAGVGPDIAQPRLVILELPYFDLQEFAIDDLHLKHLVVTGSAGLVMVPLTSSDEDPGQVIQRLIERVLDKKTVATITAIKDNRNMPQRSVAVLKLNIADFLNFQTETMATIWDNYKLTANFETRVAPILKYYRQYREQAEISLITFDRKRVTDSTVLKNHVFRRFYDYLIARISAATDFSQAVLMVYSSRPAERFPNLYSALVPVAFKGLNFNGGILYTPSTRKAGILTLNDLRSLIRSFLFPQTQPTLPIKNKPGAWLDIAYKQRALIDNYLIRWPLLTTFGYSLIGVVFLLMGGILLRWGRKVMTVLAWSFLLLLVIPAVFLVEAIFDPLTWLSISLYTVLITGIIFGAAYVCSGKDWSRTFLFISFLTAGLVIIDGLGNGYYEHKSFLGYSLVAGARYYGIGNEYMGVLLGSYLAGVALSLQHLNKRRRETLWSATLVIGLILMHPLWGADVGGGITALMGLGITNCLLLKQSIGFKAITGLILLTIVSFGVMGILDLYVYQSSMSHLGKLLLSVHRNGIGVFIDLVMRKIALNLRLISSAPLTLVLVGILVIIPLLYRFPPQPIKKLMAKYPDLIAGFVGLSATAFIGLVTNDSGIVSAAMTFLFGFGLIIALILKERFVC